MFGTWSKPLSFELKLKSFAPVIRTKCTPLAPITSRMLTRCTTVLRFALLVFVSTQTQAKAPCSHDKTKCNGGCCEAIAAQHDSEYTVESYSGSCSNSYQIWHDRGSTRCRHKEEQPFECWGPPHCENWDEISAATQPVAQAGCPLFLLLLPLTAGRAAEYN
eukprot:gnl/TRDRNA2_/TRDRNA2_48848_c0_seq1.p1 gnl/TRDRNA2_/TRDRNA2_48848_c0~~gnl/TRDRNA2_/TRDRNA2_48848_c0_seq1.p1  ORF type:complete len:162 (+),score=1.30 gnl/TRDRNA2_/TRDRNA2_48848_c0_seq1:222-707(+)